MRFLGILLMVFFACKVQAQGRVGNDSLLRVDVMDRMTRVIVFSNNEYKSGNKLTKKQESMCVGCILADMYWEYKWCEYKKLTARERREMFDFRLAHFPALRNKATVLLHRDIRKKGFGFYLEGVMANDYLAHDSAQGIATRIFTNRLRNAGLLPTDCW